MKARQNFKVQREVLSPQLTAPSFLDLLCTRAAFFPSQVSVFPDSSAGHWNIPATLNLRSPAGSEASSPSPFLLMNNVVKTFQNKGWLETTLTKDKARGLWRKKGFQTQFPDNHHRFCDFSQRPPQYHPKTTSQGHMPGRLATALVTFLKPRTIVSKYLM